MSTAGVAVAINVMPLYFGTAQYVIGVTLFIIDLIIFTMYAIDSDTQLGTNAIQLDRLDAHSLHIVSEHT